MKRAQIALVAGVALGVAGAAYYVFSQKEYRETALKLAKQSAEFGEKGTKLASEWATQGGKVAGEWAIQARKLGEDVAKQAVEQYQEKAPHAIETLSGVLPILGANKKEPTTAKA
ncbi:MAG TPA: hypothetical protein VF818_08035 [Ktedonobacterales bacterium]